MRVIAGLAAMVLMGCVTTSGTVCDRGCRLEAVKAIAAGAALPAAARITENGAAVTADQQWLNGATNVAIHGEYASETGDQAIVVGTALGRDMKPAVFGLRLRGGQAGASEAELIVARSGEAGLFPPTLPKPRDPLFDEIVDPARRTPAAQMIAAADAYFDGIEHHDGKGVPVTDACNRIENGVQTTRSAQLVDGGCNSLGAFVYIPEVRERRFPVVDETRGVVVAAVAFWIPGGDYKRMVNGAETTRHYDPRSLFLFEAFKIVEGKIARIEATMRNVPLGTSMGW